MPDDGTVKLSRIRPFCGRILLDQRLRINDLAVVAGGENAAKLLSLTVPGRQRLCLFKHRPGLRLLLVGRVSMFLQNAFDQPMQRRACLLRHPIHLISVRRRANR